MKLRSIKPVLALCRVSNLPTVWMNVLAAALLAEVPLTGAPASAWIVMLMFALSCLYCGGMALNDLCDLEYDTVHQPFRPIPAGRIKARQAWSVTALLFGAGMAILLLAPYRAGAQAGLLLLAVIYAYNRFHKAYSGSVLLMALARLLVYVVVALALTGKVETLVWLAAIAQAAYVLALTVVARAEAHLPAGRYGWPLIPWMIAAMAVLDGLMVAAAVDARWLAAGILCCAATRIGQRYVRGD